MYQKMRIYAREKIRLEKKLLFDYNFNLGVG